MSDSSGGPGWWRASDGRWYPVEAHPAWAAGQGPSPAPQPAGPPPTSRATVVIALVVVVLVAAGVLTFGLSVKTGTTAGRKLPTTASTSTTTGSTTGATTGRSTATGSVVASPTEAGVSVSPDEARDVASRLWTARMMAWSGEDGNALRVLEDGPALEADLGYLCHLGCSVPEFTAQTVTVNVPRQTTWPATLFATVSYVTHCEASASPCDDSFVAEQPARGAAWKVVLYVNYSGTLYAAQPAPGPAGYAAAPAPETDRHFGTLPAEYAAYLQAIKVSGRAPAGTRLAAGPFTIGLASHNYDPAEAQQARGEQDVTVYQAAATDAQWRFATSNSTQVTCGTVRYQATIQALPGSTLVQPSNHSTYGASLAPGPYSSVVLSGLHSVCFEAYAAATQPVTVFGTWGDLTHVSGIPAAATRA